jgi:hypothetical protein
MGFPSAKPVRFVMFVQHAKALITSGNHAVHWKSAVPSDVRHLRCHRAAEPWSAGSSGIRGQSYRIRFAERRR